MADGEAPPVKTMNPITYKIFDKKQKNKRLNVWHI
jgi:hypothetical protein